MLSRNLLTVIVVIFSVLVLFNDESSAQGVYGYATVTVDTSTNTLNGYASTETDYSTAYYYDSEVQAEIKDQDGNVLATGGNIANLSASTSIDVFQILHCVTYSIIAYIIVRPNYWGCDGGAYYDYWGFSDWSWGWYWDYGYFWPYGEQRCTWGHAIFIATIIANIIECLPVDISCNASSLEALPTGFRQGKELPFVSGTDKIDYVCTARQTGTGIPQSGVQIRFGFDPVIIDYGGHQGHSGQRPKGTFSRTSVRTDSNGEARTVYTTSPFGGSVRLNATTPGQAGYWLTDVYAKVPGLVELSVGPNYRLRQVDPKHPAYHWGTQAANNGLVSIANDYKDEFYPNGWVPPPPGTYIDPADNDQPIDYYKIHFNDQSLRLGGKFEIAGSWGLSGAHDEHRIGINCDTRSRNVDRVRWPRLNQIFFSRGSTRTNDETNTGSPHWHLRFEFGGQAGQPVTTSPYNGFPAAVPGSIQAEQFDIGGNGSAYHIPFSEVPNPDERPDDVSLYGPDGNTYVGPTRGGQWINYTVDIAATRSYSIDTRVSSVTGGNTFHIEVDGVDKTGPIAIPNTGSINTFDFVRVDDILLNAGQYSMRLVINGNGENVGNFDYFTISPYDPVVFCNPDYWELESCHITGGYWDYNLCACNYGPLGY